MAPKAPVNPVKPTSLFDVPKGFFQGVVVYRPDVKSFIPGKLPVEGESRELRTQDVKLDALSSVLPGVHVDGEEDLEIGSRGQGVDAADEESNEETGMPQRGLACGACGGVQFTSLVEQRFHFKMDVHRLNVKRRLKGKPPLTEAEFETKITSEQGSAAGGTADDGSDVSSISGSDTDSSSDDEGGDGATKRSRKLDERQLQRKAAKVTFALDGGCGEKFAIWRSVLLGEKETLDLDLGKRGGEDGNVSEEQILDRLRRFTDAGISTASTASDSKASQGGKVGKAGSVQKQDGGPHVAGQNPGGIVKSVGQQKESFWVVLLAGGGHFAGVVMDTSGPQVVAHQTFHRYVVRAKQGGRQSAKDGTGRAPKSGGASLRRYNEAALAKDIRELLGVIWKDYVRNASLIFVRASAADSRSLYGGESPPLQQGDPRVRSIPLTTRRPTFKEAQRVGQALAFIDWSPPQEETVPEQDPASIVIEAEEIPKGAKEGDSKSGSLAGSTDTEKWPWGTTLPIPPEATLSTPLHEAALANDAEQVRVLLEGGANPEARDARGRTPYVVATDKEVRNAFRRFMAAHMDAFDWHAADVPSPLTEDMEATQAAKRAEKKAKMKEREKEKRRERRAEEKAKQAEQEAAAAAAAKAAKESKGGRGKGTGSSTGSGIGTPESIAAEREMRAKAAERRLQQSGGSAQPASDGAAGKATGGAEAGGQAKGPSSGPQCDCCKVSLSGKIPFYKFAYKYCSTTCIRVHMAQLAEE